MRPSPSPYWQEQAEWFNTQLAHTQHLEKNLSALGVPPQPALRSAIRTLTRSGRTDLFQTDRGRKGYPRSNDPAAQSVNCNPQNMKFDNSTRKPEPDSAVFVLNV